MKKILQQVFVNSLALYITSLLLAGLKIDGDIKTIILGGVFLTIGFTIVKPILDTLTLPFNLASLGLFSFLTTTFILFVTTMLYPSIKIVAFNFKGFSLYGIEIKSFFVSGFFAYFFISATIYIINRFLSWLFSR